MTLRYGWCARDGQKAGVLAVVLSQRDERRREMRVKSFGHCRRMSAAMATISEEAKIRCAAVRVIEMTFVAT
jgi:hypothetical protein